MVRERLGLHTVLGVSNISFGLPNRELITGSFLTQALEEGLDLPIINPNQSAVMDAIAAFKVLHGEDQNSVRYIERFAQISGKPDRTQEKPAHVVDLPEAIEKGLREEARVLTRACLKDRDELAVIQELLIPALDRVGDRYEKNEIFLPQLMNAAAAACEAVGRQPECKSDVTSTLILGVALSETTGIYGFVTGLLLIFLAPGMFMKFLA